MIYVIFFIYNTIYNTGCRSGTVKASKSLPSSSKMLPRVKSNHRHFNSFCGTPCVSYIIFFIYNNSTVFKNFSLQVILMSSIIIEIRRASRR